MKTTEVIKKQYTHFKFSSRFSIAFLSSLATNHNCTEALQYLYKAHDELNKALEILDQIAELNGEPLDE